MQTFWECEHEADLPSTLRHAGLAGSKPSRFETIKTVPLIAQICYYIFCLNFLERREQI